MQKDYFYMAITTHNFIQELRTWINALFMNMQKKRLTKLVNTIHIHDVTSKCEQVLGWGVYSYNAFVRLNRDQLLCWLLLHYFTRLPVPNRWRQRFRLSVDVNVARDVRDGGVAEVGTTLDETMTMLRRKNKPERIERSYVLPRRATDVISGLPHNSIDVVT